VAVGCEQVEGAAGLIGGCGERWGVWGAVRVHVGPAGGVTGVDVGRGTGNGVGERDDRWAGEQGWCGAGDGRGGNVWTGTVERDDMREGRRPWRGGRG